MKDKINKDINNIYHKLKHTKTRVDKLETTLYVGADASVSPSTHTSNVAVGQAKAFGPSAGLCTNVKLSPGQAELVARLHEEDVDCIECSQTPDRPHNYDKTRKWYEEQLAEAKLSNARLVIKLANVPALKFEIDQLKARGARLHFHEDEKTIERLTNQVTNLNRDNRHLHDLLDSQTDFLGVKSNEIADLKAKLASYELHRTKHNFGPAANAIINKLKAENNQLKKEPNRVLRTQLKRFREKCDNLERENSQLKAQRDSWQHYKTKVHALNDELEDENSQLKAQYESLEHDMCMAANRAFAAESKNEKLEAQCVRLKKGGKERWALSRKLKTERDKLTLENKTLKNVKAFLLKESNAVKADQDKINIAHREEYQELHTKILHWQGLYTDCSVERNNLTSENKDLANIVKEQELALTAIKSSTDWLAKKLGK